VARSAQMIADQAAGPVGPAANRCGFLPAATGTSVAPLLAVPRRAFPRRTRLGVMRDFDGGCGVVENSGHLRTVGTFISRFQRRRLGRFTRDHAAAGLPPGPGSRRRVALADQSVTAV